jgi:hypothetical protein
MNGLVPAEIALRDCSARGITRHIPLPLQPPLGFQPRLGYAAGAV